MADSQAHGALEAVDVASVLGRDRSADLRAFLKRVVGRISRSASDGAWIHRCGWAEVEAQVDALESRARHPDRSPLYGVPFAVKDNVDVAGMPTTAACREFSYVPAQSATAVSRLQQAGAIVVGKTNLDQFATGLVGTRSPFEACRNPFDPRFISGGSSSGSAVAVARGQVSFALGTDTAGSGRVPAGFSNIVGLKPTRGLVSTTGVFPACRSLDCVSVFAGTCDDARAVLQVMQGYDPTDPFSRTAEDLPQSRSIDPMRFRFGVPGERDRRFFGNVDAERLFDQAIERAAAIGGEALEIDFAPFARAAAMLYEGPWLAERYLAVRDFMNRSPGAMLDVTREIISRGQKFSATDGFEAQYELQSLRQEARAAWERMDVMLVPTAGTIYTIDEVNADPFRLNVNLGYYTNFVNLMDLCAVAVPSGFQANGLPAGVTFIGQAGADRELLELADAFHRRQDATIGATGMPLPPKVKRDTQATGVLLAVVGAHLSSQSLNHQLTSRGAALERTCRTAADYRLFALPGTVPAKPGLVRVAAGSGVAIEVEVWRMTEEAFGSFVAAVPPPMGIGTVRLEDGSSVKGFICEGLATEGAADISQFGSWRRFLASR